MSYLKAGAAFLVAFLMQGSILNLVSVAGHTPNLLLCLVVMTSFLYEKEMYGLLYGALFGVIYDICYSYVIGPTAITLVLVAITVLALRYYANVENAISMLVVSMIAFIIYYVVNWGLYFIAGNPMGIGYVFASSIGTIIYSLFVNFIIYKAMIKNVIKHHKDRYFI